MNGAQPVVARKLPPPEEDKGGTFLFCVDAPEGAPLFQPCAFTIRVWANTTEQVLHCTDHGGYYLINSHEGAKSVWPK